MSTPEGFLTPEQIRHITRCGRKKDQCEWLAANGLKYFVGRNGWPSVPSAQVFPEQERHPGPDFEALDRVS